MLRDEASIYGVAPNSWGGRTRTSCASHRWPRAPPPGCRWSRGHAAGGQSRRPRPADPRRLRLPVARINAHAAPLRACRQPVLRPRSRRSAARRRGHWPAVRPIASVVSATAGGAQWVQRRPGRDAHIMGTARMGTTVALGDRTDSAACTRSTTFPRDGSVFVSAGGVHPTLTIMGSPCGWPRTRRAAGTGQRPARAAAPRRGARRPRADQTTATTAAAGARGRTELPSDAAASSTALPLPERGHCPAPWCVRARRPTPDRTRLSQGRLWGPVCLPDLIRVTVGIADVSTGSRSASCGGVRTRSASAPGAYTAWMSATGC